MELRQSWPNHLNSVARLAALESPLFESSKAPGFRMKISHYISSPNLSPRDELEMSERHSERRMHGGNAISQRCSFRCPKCLAVTQQYLDVS